MKGSSLKNFIVIVASISLVLLSYVVVRSEIKRITREKIMKHDMLNERLNRIEAKLVQIQKLTAEERIVKMAQDSLGLIRPEENLEIIPVSKDQIVQMEKLLKVKYE
jgi:cell division protein FtsL